jgi:hypothetical protein
MTHHLLISASVLLFIPRALAAQSVADRIAALLPSGAKVVETADLTAAVHKPRTLVLWMLDAERHENEEEYCGTPVYGDYWKGRARLSLIDPSEPRLIGTVDITVGGPADVFSLPFHVGNAYYHVRNGSPELLHLRDLTGDGVAAEVVFFDYVACGIVAGSVFGYRADQDTIVQYPIEIRAAGKTSEARWLDQVFSSKPVRPGVWSHTWRPGHGSDAIIHDDVTFDRARQIFIDRRRVTGE